MKTAKASKPSSGSGGQSGSASPKPMKSWSKIAAGGQSRPVSQESVGQRTAEGPSDDKMLAVLSSLTNTEAEITTKSSGRYRGIVKTVDPSSETLVVLKNAKHLSNVNGAATQVAELKIKADDLVEVFAAKVNLGRSAETPAQPGTTAPKANAWKTDTDISGRTQVKERVLQAWQPPPEDEGFGIEDDLSSARPSSNGKKWDQFAANEKLFGVKSEWDEDVYTHKLDTSRPDFAKRQAEAERLAREIEQSSATNVHVLEERGIVDDSGLTEEDKYSGVQRGSNAWVPPARRPVTNLPGSRNAQPVDPAIISSQLAKPGSSGLRTTVPVRSSEQPPPGSTQGNEKSDAPAKPSNPIETDIMARFKQFASSERDRLSVRKAATFKKEKDGRLQDLLAFSKDFKLNTPVPEDLIPILAKDKAKQDAIVQKAASSTTSSPITKAAETKLPDTLRSRVEKARATPAAELTASPVPKEKTPDLRKLKPSAAEFKPFNPSASSFTPNLAARPPQPVSPALSNTSSHPRQVSYSVDAPVFFPRKPKAPSSRSPILAHFDPFLTFRTKNPDSVLDIETPLKVDPSWPGEESQSIMDPPHDTRRPPHLDEQYQSSVPQFVQTSPMMFAGSPQSAHGFQHQGYYGNKGQQFVPVQAGQFVPYQAAPGYAPQHYMYQGAQGFNSRSVQPQMIAMQYPAQQFNGYNAQMGLAMGAPTYPNHLQGSPRPRQPASHGQQRSPELQKPSPRAPPMNATKDP